MKLSHLLTESKNPFKKGSVEYIFNEIIARQTVGEGSSKYYAVTKRMMKKYPQFVYEGVMYRTIGINYHKRVFKPFSPGDKFGYHPKVPQFTFRSQKALMKHIREKNEKMLSWSSTEKGMYAYEKHASRGTQNTHVGIVIEQNGVGFNLAKYNQLVRDTYKDYKKFHITLPIGVDEVLADMNNSAKINRYVVNRHYYEPNELVTAKEHVRELTKRGTIYATDYEPDATRKRRDYNK